MFGRILLLAILGEFLIPATAHTPSTSWLTLNRTNHAIQGQWEIALRDLNDVLGLDANDDGSLTWGELRARFGDITTLALHGLEIRTGGHPLPIQFHDLQVSQRLDTPCAVLAFETPISGSAEEFTLSYSLFFDHDPLHRCLISSDHGNTTAVLSPDAAVFSCALDNSQSQANAGTFVREGIHHIWTGFDHLAFLLALLLPAVLRRTPQGWRGATEWPVVLADVVKVVTAFTIAHSMTLALAAFGILQLPPTLVEITIAASILVAVALIAVPLRENPSHPAPPPRHGWPVAFAFGLIHGFGFAGALGELGLTRGRLAGPLLGFNVGVELGQLACVAVFLPIAFSLRHTPFYRFVALPIGCGAIGLAATGWLIERAMGLTLMPF